MAGTGKIDSAAKKVRSKGGSMAPFIPPDSELVTHEVKIDGIEVGDVVCYIDSHSKGVAHRVVSIDNSLEEPCFFTRGDARGHVERVPSSSLIHLVSRVESRYFSYDTDGVVGEIIKAVALAESKKARLAKSGLNAAWRMLGLAVRLKKKLTWKDAGE